MCDKVLLREIECKHCRQIFYVCRSCYKNQVYCSSECRSSFQAAAHRRRQSRYRTSFKGRLKNRIGSKERRLEKNKKNVADDTPISNLPVLTSHQIESQLKPRCRFCGVYGVVVKRFPARGYNNPKIKTVPNLRC